jgi:hypothetical protein
MRDSFRHGIGAHVLTRSQPDAILSNLTDALPLDLTYINADGQTVGLDINLLEAIAVIVGLIALIQHMLRSPRPLYPVACERPFVHVHLWSDNTSAMWWLTLNRTSSPFHAALFQMFAQVQLLSGVVVTLGYVRGEDNFLADASSRNYIVADGKGELYRRMLTAPTVQQWPASLDWIYDLAQQCSSPSRDISQPAPVVLIHAAKLCSRPSV